MRRIVLDTNCLLQALPSRSPYHKIWSEILAGHVSLCVNTEILNEYEEIIARKTNADIAHNVVEAIARLHTTEFLNVYYHFRLIEADADDNKSAMRHTHAFAEGCGAAYRAMTCSNNYFPDSNRIK